MQTLVTIAIFTNLVTGQMHAFRVDDDVKCEDVIQREVVRKSWGEDVFKGDRWIAECERRREW